MTQKVLFITYLFPPTGGSGVQRKLKYIKYLPAFDWHPYVLTVKPITYYVYDHSLTKDIPKEATIIRTESLDPLRLSYRLRNGTRTNTPHSQTNNQAPIQYVSKQSWFVQLYQQLRIWLSFPDPQFGWIPFAVRAGKKAVLEHNIPVIVASAHPSSGVIAHLIAKATNRPYVLDFADGWTDNPYLKTPTKLHRKAHEWLEARVVGQADGVTTYGETLAQKFEARYPKLQGHAITLPNGFDPDDFAQIDPIPKSNGQRRIVYMGSLYKHQENNFIAFLEALNLIPETLRQQLEIIFVGNYYAEAPGLVAKAHLTDQFSFLGYQPHTKALSYLASADAGLLFIQRADYTMVTGKVFEYLMAQLPILASIEPNGACAKILHQAEQDAWITSPDEKQEIAETLKRLAEQGWPKPSAKGLARFNRKQNTGKLAVQLQKLIRS